MVAGYSDPSQDNKILVYGLSRGSWDPASASSILLCVSAAVVSLGWSLSKLELIQGPDPILEHGHDVDVRDTT